MPLTDKRIIELSKEIKDLSMKRDSLELKIKSRKEKVLKAMEAKGVKSIEAGGYKVTYVQNETPFYVVPALEAELDPKMWKRITSRSLDKSKLSQAIMAGKIDLEILDKCTEIKKSAPYVVISEKATS